MWNNMALIKTSMQSLCQLKFAFVFFCSCDEPETPLPTQLRENCSRSPWNQNWLGLDGGARSRGCGAAPLEGSSLQHGGQFAPSGSMNGKDLKS